MTWLTLHERATRAYTGLLGSGDPVLPVDQGLFKLPLQQTTRMVASLLRLPVQDWLVPVFAKLCRRQSELGAWPQRGRVSPSNACHPNPYRSADGPPNLLVTSGALLRNILPGCGQHWNQGPWRWRVAVTCSPLVPL